jgi:hypothetical protein
MLSPVLKNIDEAVAHIARGGERSSVIPIDEHPTLAAKRAVDGTRHANREATREARECHAVGRLGYEVDVIGLDGEVHDAKAGTGGAAERGSNAEKEELSSQARQPSAHAQRDMNRMSGNVSRTPAVWNPLATLPFRSPSPRPLTTPRIREGKLRLNHARANRPSPNANPH